MKRHASLATFLKDNEKEKNENVDEVPGGSFAAIVEKARRDTRNVLMFFLGCAGVSVCTRVVMHPTDLCCTARRNTDGDTDAGTHG